jgi:dihydrofolate reductase
MSTTFTVDFFMTLDGYGSAEGWPGYWGKEGPEIRQDRVDTFAQEQVLVLGADTFKGFAKFVKIFDEPYYDSMNELPKIVFSSTIDPDAPGWENSTVLNEDAVTAIERLKRTTDIPMRSHGSISLNRALLAAGLVDRLEVTIFPAITGTSGYAALLHDGAEFDLELLETKVLDGQTVRLVYKPTLHTAVPEGAGPKVRGGDQG